MHLEHLSPAESGEHMFKPFSELPQSHLEHVRPTSLEKLSGPAAYGAIGSAYFSQLKDTAPGIWRAFTERSASDPTHSFPEMYAQYASDPEALKGTGPEGYAFMRDRIFFGREYDAAQVSTVLRPHAFEGRCAA